MIRQDFIVSDRFLRRFALVLVFLFCLSARFPVAAAALDILIGTGDPGTFSHFAGRTLCRTIDAKSDDLSCEAVPAPNDLHNLTNLSIGSLDLALIDSLSLFDAVNRAGDFQFLDIGFGTLRVLAKLYEVPAALVVRSDAGIESLEGLKGKRVDIGVPNSPQRRIFSSIFEAKGWIRSDFSLVEELSASQSVDSMAFCHGTIQAMLHIGVHPDASMRQLIRLCEARLVDILDADTSLLIRNHAAFCRVTVPAKTYRAMAGSVSTIGTRVLLVASSDLSEAAAYRILDAMVQGRRGIENAHPALAPFDAASAAGDDLKIPLHRGAARYLREHGS